ncbi:MAG: transcriptional regulator [Verrucomicrobia bacterium]|nr:transcriptional regulator [Verrucomicrobiota bacterium]
MKPIDFHSLDTAIHGPIRLGILTALQIDGVLDFTTLKKRLNVADGALGLHLQKLQEANYIRANKTFIGKRPNTSYHITFAGRKSLGAYLNQMRQVIDAVTDAATEKHLADRVRETARSRPGSLAFRPA